MEEEQCTVDISAQNDVIDYFKKGYERKEVITQKRVLLTPQRMNVTNTKKKKTHLGIAFIFFPRKRRMKRIHAANYKVGFGKSNTRTWIYKSTHFKANSMC